MHHDRLYVNNMDPLLFQSQQQQRLPSSLTTMTTPISTSHRSSSSSSSSWTISSSLYQIWAVCVGLWACLGCLWTLIILHVCVRPFSISVYRRWSNRVASGAFLDTLALLAACNTTIHISPDSDIPSPMSTCIFVCNHVSISQDVDWWCMMLLYRVLGFQGTVKTFCHPQQQVRGGLDGTTKTTAVTQHSSSTNPTSSSSSFPTHHPFSIVSSLSHFVLHTLLEYPILSSPDQEEQYIQYKAQVTPLLSSSTGASDAAQQPNHNPLHLLLFPEKMTPANTTWLTKSQMCAQREGRPRLQHVLLPHTTAFHATLECVRLYRQDAIHPLVYDITLAYNINNNNNSDYHNKYSSSILTFGDGLVISFSTLLRILTGHGIPTDIHVKIKKYNLSMVAQDSSWLDKVWYEKDTVLDYYKVHGQYPITHASTKNVTTTVTATTTTTPTTRMITTTTMTNRSSWILSSRTWNIENSIIAFIRFCVIPCMIPILIFFSFPIVCILIWVYLARQSYQLLFHGITSSNTSTRLFMDSTQGGGAVVSNMNTSSSTTTNSASSTHKNNNSNHSSSTTSSSMTMMTSNKSGDVGFISSGTTTYSNNDKGSNQGREDEEEEEDEKRRNETSSLIMTPMIPATPFASPKTPWIVSSGSSSSSNNTMNK